MGERLRIRTLGRLSISVDGEALTGFASRKAEVLLVYLACNPRPHPREVLADLLWDDRSQRQAMANLRVVLSSLRKEVGSFVNITRHEAGMNSKAPVWVDALALEAAACAVQEAGCVVDEGQAAEVEAAATLYKGDFLAGAFVPEASGFEMWAATERERLHRLVVDALQKVSAWHLGQDDYGAAIAAATRLVEVDPLAEAGHRLLMEALARNGQRGQALAQYDTCRAMLAEELGVEPAPETRQLREHIAQGTLPERVQAPAALMQEALAAPPITQDPSFLRKERALQFGQELHLERGDELQQLHEHLRQARGGDGRVAFVRGEAGAGKTACVQAFAREAAEEAPDLLVVAGSSSALGESAVAYGPFRQVASLLAGDVEDAWRAGQLDEEGVRRLWQAMPAAARALIERGPHLLDIFMDGQGLVQRLSQAYGRPTALQQALEERLAQAPVADEVLQRSDLHQEYTAVLQALSREHPLLLVLDDLHWADQATLNLLFHLGRALATSRILLLGTYRPAELRAREQAEPHPLQKVLAEFRRLYGAIEVDLDAVSADRGRAFVDRLLDSEANRLGLSFREALFARTGGHPLFTVELLRALQERGDLAQDEQGAWYQAGDLAWERLPAQIEGVIEARLGRLAGPQQELLRVAGVDGETFTAEVVARVLGREEGDVIRELSGALERGHRLVAARGTRRVDGQRLSRYRFRHQLFQAYLYRALDEVERAYLHEGVGRALEGLYAGRTEAVAAQLAYHYAEAGVDEKALDYSLQAGDAAWELFAYEEAADYYERAVRVLQEQGAAGRAGRLLMKLGLAYHNAGHFIEADRAYDEGFRLLQQVPVTPAAVLPPAPHPLRTRFSSWAILDPAYVHTDWDAGLAGRLFEGLVRAVEWPELVPGVAERWQIGEGGRRYVFHLRRNARWSDGRPLTAHDFVYAWRRVLDPATASPAVDRLYEIQGARAYHEGKHGDPNRVGMQAVDDQTLRVELERPTSYFLYTLSKSALLPVPRHVVQAQGAAWTRPAHFVGNGPFKLVAWEEGEQMVLERNGWYGQPTGGNVQRIVLHHFALNDELEALYADDALDVIPVWAARTLAERLRRRHPGDYRTGPAPATGYLAIRQQSPPFDDVRIRRALALALDREALVHSLGIQHFLPATGGFLPPGKPGFAEGAGLPFAPAEARRLLAEAGYPDGHDFPPVQVVGWSGADGPALLRAMTDQWARHLGLSIGIRLEEDSHYLAKLRSAPPPLYILGYGADYPDASDFLVHGLGEYRSFRDERFDDLLAQARRTLDPVQRATIYREADALLMREAYIVPLVYYRGLVLLVKPWISSLMGLQWENAVIEPH